MKKLRFLRAWKAYRKGQVADIPGGKAIELIAGRYAVEERQTELIETAAVEHAVETADATPKRRRKK